MLRLCTYMHRLFVIATLCRYFHVCEGGLIPDVMHDVLEGALVYEAKPRTSISHWIS